MLNPGDRIEVLVPTIHIDRNCIIGRVVGTRVEFYYFLQNGSIEELPHSTSKMMLQSLIDDEKVAIRSFSIKDERSDEELTGRNTEHSILIALCGLTRNEPINN
jgi:hypothetical protein